MKTRLVTITAAVVALAQISAEPPDSLNIDRPINDEIERHVNDVQRHIDDALQEFHREFPKGLKNFTEGLEKFTEKFSRDGQFMLAQADPGAPPGVPVPAPGAPVDPAAIVDWANNLAAVTTRATLDGIFPRSAPRKPVIVGASGDAKARTAMEEDLNVMMRILEKAAGGKDEARPTAGGIELFSFGKSSAPRVFYIDGHGAMFVLNVRYPLLAPPAKDDQTRTNEQTNTEWEKAREEVYGRRTRFEDMKFNAGPAEEFDSQRVEDLKEQIINDLVNAKNIRGLKPDDYVTVVVLGGGTRGGIVRRETRAPGGRGGGGRGGDAYAAVEVSSSSVDGGMQTTMTLRAKKSDIDAFTNGKLDAENFKKKVSAQIY